MTTRRGPEVKQSRAREEAAAEEVGQFAPQPLPNGRGSDQNCGARVASSQATVGAELAQPTMHANCVVCGPCNGRGLRLEFDTAADGSVSAEFGCDAMFEGYAGKLHGGIISAILDGAMTNCLFAHGHPGVTAELTVRFRHPVRTSRPALAKAWIERCSPPLHVLRAELSQAGELKATATGKFMDHTRAG